MKCTELEKEKEGLQTECEELRESQHSSEVAAAGAATAAATDRAAMVAAAAAEAAAAAAEADTEAVFLNERRAAAAGGAAAAAAVFLSERRIRIRLCGRRRIRAAALNSGCGAAWRRLLIRAASGAA